MRENLFWYKFQPNSLNNIILLPRIRELVKDGIKMNLVFYSDTPGTGKSSLARILCKGTDTVEFNSSQDTSVDILRTDIKNHCKSLSPFMPKGTLKTVFLDEFDGVSEQYKKAMKGFSDKYQHVRFILTTNHIEQIGDKILSRFTKVDFTPKTQEENDYLKGMYFKYLKAISTKVKMKISDEEIEKIIGIHFPDLRSAVQKLQEIFITNDKNDLSSITTSGYDDIFSFLMNHENNIHENWHFVMDNYQDNPLELMKALGRPFFVSYMNSHDNTKTGAMILNTQKSYNERYNETIDPLIHLVSYVTDIKDIIKNN